MNKIDMQLKVNGQLYDVLVPAHRTLLEVLREELGLTGTKEGCDAGDCGSCNVIIDGKSVLACLTLAVEAQGRDILTIEGLAREGRLHPVQDAFVKYGAVQC